LIALALLPIVLANPTLTTDVPFTADLSVHACGAKLKELFKRVCPFKEQILKDSLFDHETEELRFKRSPNVVQLCCKNACTIRTILRFCPK
jgi:hypothetical protein